MYFYLMKIALLTLVIGDKYKNAVNMAIETKKIYCEKHGYDFIIGDESIYDTNRPIAWSKIQLLKKHLGNYDYVFLSDADVVIMNDTIKIEKYINDYFKNNIKLVVTRDQQNINTGNMILKNDKEVFCLLDNIYNQTGYINSGWWEQSAFIFLFNNNEYIRQYTTVIQDSHILNAYILEIPGLSLPERCKYRTGDFLIHLAGIDNITHLKDLIKICLDIKQKEKEEGFNNYLTITI